MKFLLTDEEFTLEKESINMIAELDILMLEHEYKMNNIGSEILTESYSHDIARDMFMEQMNYFAEATESMWEKFKKWITGVFNAIFGKKEKGKTPPPQALAEKKTLNFDMSSVLQVLKTVAGIVTNILGISLGAIGAGTLAFNILGVSINVLDMNSVKEGFEKIKSKITGKKTVATGKEIVAAEEEAQSLFGSIRDKILSWINALGGKNKKKEDGSSDNTDSSDGKPNETNDKQQNAVQKALTGVISRLGALPKMITNAFNGLFGKNADNDDGGKQQQLSNNTNTQQNNNNTNDETQTESTNSIHKQVLKSSVDFFQELFEEPYSEKTDKWI